MKKFTAVMILITLMLISVCMAGCGSNKNSGTKEKESDTKDKAPVSTIQNALLKDAESKMLEALAPLPDMGKGEKIGAVAFSMTNPFWVTVEEGYKDAAKEYGVQVDVVAAPNEADENGQAEAFNTLLTKDYDAFAISSMTPFNLVPSVAKATKKGLKVIAVGTNIDAKAAKDAGAVVEAFVTSDFKEQGKMGAEFIMKKIGGPAKVAVIEGQAGSDNSEQRKQGAIEGFKNNGGEVVAVEAADWDAQKAYDAATNILKANPDLKGIMCANDDMALGVVEALKAANKKDQVVVCGIDFIDNARKSIMAGELDGSVAMSPYLFGKAGLILSLKAIQGQEINKDIFWTPIGLITAENVAQYDGWK
ncbi:MAG: Periplasmic binding protein/LacI transcriptional regulator [Desulfotomaculum sp. 46_80]|nr:MAG: Periplasmic binding protein/LacI transcriptional regulator [Desulfotomaculum sp. 46_80]